MDSLKKWMIICMVHTTPNHHLTKMNLSIVYGVGERGRRISSPSADWKTTFFLPFKVVDSVEQLALSFR